ncbi:MAG: 16S rRNA (guanine(966)-N(2))-methyltransferase RsmD [Nitrospirae bacterium]|nr:16S rRNA (guanine(966)-N(2))-methyltransferase RsmD [Nitrospirota bacterium]
MTKTLRPTTSKVREAVFNILRDKIRDAGFLDLYAGTGAIGLEALKHGAKEVIFVDAGRNYTQSITQIISKRGLALKSRVITKKVLSLLQGDELKDMSFDIIFLDPPYHTGEINEALTAIGKSHMLKREGIVIAEHFVKKQLPHEFGSLRLIKDYRYGDTVLSFHKQTGETKDEQACNLSRNI